MQLLPGLTNGTTRLTGEMIALLEVTDLRYTIRTYAVYFGNIPQRIGADKVLDASVEALTSTFDSFRTDTDQRAAMEKYGQALRALKESLYDPVAAHSSATLCAVHLMWIAQVRREDYLAIYKSR